MTPQEIKAIEEAISLIPHLWITSPQFEYKAFVTNEGEEGFHVTAWELQEEGNFVTLKYNVYPS